MKENYTCEHYIVEDGYDTSDDGIKKLPAAFLVPIMPKDKKFDDENNDNVWDD